MESNNDIYTHTVVCQIMEDDPYHSYNNSNNNTGRYSKNENVYTRIKKKHFVVDGTTEESRSFSLFSLVSYKDSKQYSGNK